MSDVARLLKQVNVDWQVDEWNRLLAGTEKRQRVRVRRRRMVTGALWSILVVGGVGLGVLGLRTGDAPTTVASLSPADGTGATGASLRTVRFSDGSTVTLLNSASTLGTREVSSDNTDVELLSGSARFEVSHARARRFRVTSGAVAIEVLGTVFTLDRTQQGTRVSVEQGVARVDFPGGTREVRAGETAVFTPPSAEGPAPARPTETKPEAKPEAKPEDAKPRASADHGAWRRLANAKDFDRAYAALEPETVKDEPADLLLAADVARLSGHPAKAVPYLRKVVTKYPEDQRAAAAAFTLGRVLLEDTHQPGEAARAFGRARSMAPDGILAEDAIVRQIEALVAAGEMDSARVVAQRYRKEYPDGRRRRQVERLVTGP